MYLHSSCCPSLQHSVSVFFCPFLYHIIPHSCVYVYHFSSSSFNILHFSLYYSQIYFPLILSSSSITPSYIFSIVLVYHSSPHCLPKFIIFQPLHILQTTPTSCLSDSLRATSTPTASQKIKTSNNYDEELNNHKQCVHNNG